jgi:hypothetical protein
MGRSLNNTSTTRKRVSESPPAHSLARRTCMWFAADVVNHPGQQLSGWDVRQGIAISVHVWYNSEQTILNCQRQIDVGR